MLTKSGVKVLDFGLARLSRDASAADASGRAAPAAAPVRTTRTESHAITEQGAVLGTLPYMAPEQIEGLPADVRTDIFALGAVIFEMVTGQRPFQGPSAARTLAAIIETDPPAVSSLQPRVPAAIDRVVRKCLAKDPDKRWQSAGDLGDELRWIREGGAALSTFRRRSPSIPTTDGDRGTVSSCGGGSGRLGGAHSAQAAHEFRNLRGSHG